MHRNLFLNLAILIFLLPFNVLADIQTIHHNLQMTINPGEGTLQAEDRLTLPTATSEVEFLLHAGLEVTPLTHGARIQLIEEIQSSVRVKRYKVILPKPATEVAVGYQGAIKHKMRRISQGYAGGREATAGVISEKGVFLGLSSFWYPAIDFYPISFDLDARLPEGWSTVSQGVQDEKGVWRGQSPQDEIYLVAGRYHRYTKPGNVAESQVYLSTPDEKLAERYLKATQEYLSLYQRLLGPYPYKKFALVENFWETGYGMPSFTLLGPKVIRLPFIIVTSYPHEILHNWWGNSVFVDYQTGNWSEGLTSYLADHLMKEQAGNGAQYRRDTLQSYADYVAKAEDFPLTAFRGNHGQVSQAVGYGRTLMFFHMLRQKLGDDLFVAGLRRFYRDNLFRVAGFDDIRKAFEAVSEENLEAAFKQWTGRTGAPAFAVKDIKVTQFGIRYTVSGRIEQTQDGAPFSVSIPVFTQVEEHDSLIRRSIEVSERSATFKLSFKKRPLRMRFDPRFDIFRQLDPSEIPSSFGQLFGAKKVTFVLPADATRTIRRAYEQMAEHWADADNSIEITWDADIESLPKDRAVWLLGASNSFANLFDAHIRENSIAINNELFELDNFSAALTRRHPENSDLTLGLITLHDRDAVKGMVRKLPHYSKYSYTVFDGYQLANKAKGQWPTENSALTVVLDESAEYPE
ncbi:M1 family metallopeptidase [Solemya velesiana gill symbiont]|nr:M1 family aminopeptidase [Solemya velesiana gill symbiont]